MMVMAMMQWTREDPQTLFPELCRRPADLNPDDKERGDRRPRWQHLSHQRRLQRESLPGGAASSPRPWHCQALPGPGKPSNLPNISRIYEAPPPPVTAIVPMKCETWSSDSREQTQNTNFVNSHFTPIYYVTFVKTGFACVPQSKHPNTFISAFSKAALFSSDVRKLSRQAAL